ncbi:hypothetical protein RBH85_01800 [Streptomyces rochei]|nr:hypothetical protein [Streptomyces rochei]WMI55655.1 hypothetical protein RBH85_01800 [Streptomyces rochei]
MAAAVGAMLVASVLSTAATPAHADSGSPAAPADATAVWEPAPPPEPEDPATPVVLSRGGLTVRVAEEFPQVVSYDLDGRRLDGRAEVLDTFTVNGKAHKARTTMKARHKATYTSTFADLPGLTLTTGITVTDRRTVVFAVEKISGSAAGTVRELAVPDQSLVSVDSGDRERAWRARRSRPTPRPPPTASSTSPPPPSPTRRRSARPTASSPTTDWR